MARWILRATFLAIALLLALALRPATVLVGPHGYAVAPNLLIGLIFAACAWSAERLIAASDPGAAAGAALGGLTAGLFATVAIRVLPDSGGEALARIRPFLYLVALYAGTVGGAHVGSALRARRERAPLPGVAPVALAAPPPGIRLLDTSAVIDGRLGAVLETGFSPGPVVVPGFVLRELQHIADHADPLRRARGRRGLDMLERLKAIPGVEVTFPEDDVPEAGSVDEKLVEYARRAGASLITTDYNLNKVAGLRGVRVLNVNDLAHAVRPAALPGESLRVEIVKEGKEPGQGIAYLDDGTMVVVEQGRDLVGRTVDVVVTSALQTAAGKMFFARIEE